MLASVDLIAIYDKLPYSTTLTGRENRHVLVSAVGKGKPNSGLIRVGKVTTVIQPGQLAKTKDKAELLSVGAGKSTLTDTEI